MRLVWPVLVIHASTACLLMGCESDSSGSSNQTSTAASASGSGGVGGSGGAGASGAGTGGAGAGGSGGAGAGGAGTGGAGGAGAGGAGGAGTGGAGPGGAGPGGAGGMGGFGTGGTGGAGTGGAGGAGTGGSGGFGTGGAATASSSATGTGGTGGATTSSTSGSGGSGGTGGTGGAGGGGGGANECTPNDAPVVCDDLNPCTDESCPAGMCVHAPSAPGTPCGGSVQACDGSGTCTGGGSPITSLRIGDANVQAGERIAIDGSGNFYVIGSFLGTADFGDGPFVNAKGGQDAFLAKFDSTGDLLWSKHFSGTGTTIGLGVAVDGMGKVTITGSFDGSVDLGGGPLTATGTSRDVFVAKFDGSGNPLWSQRFGDLEDQVGQGISANSAGDVFVTGYFHNTIDFGGFPMASGGSNAALFVVKFDDAGNHVWSVRFGGGDGLSGAAGYENGNSIAVSATGRLVLFGCYYGTLDFGTGPLVSAGGSSDLFLATLDGSGAAIFSVGFGDTDEQFGRDIAIDAAGNLIVAGHFGGILDFGGGPLISAGASDIFVTKLDAGTSHLWSRRFGDAAAQNAYGVAIDATGNVLVGGSFDGSVDFGDGPIASAGKSDAFLAKLDSTGDPVWSKGFGDSAGQSARDAAVLPTGEAVITGFFEGNTDFGGGTLSAGGSNVFVAQYDANGQHVFSKQSGVAADQHVDAITADAMDSLCVLGSFDGLIDLTGSPLVSKGGTDVFVASLDALGSPIWARSFGDPSYQAGTGIVRDAMGEVLITGAFASSIDFGGGPLMGAGLTDIFLAKLDSTGGHIFSKSFGDALEQRAEAIAVDAFDNVAITGFFTGTVDFGGGLMINAGGADIFVARFDSAGGHLFSDQFGDSGTQRGASIAVDSSGAMLITGAVAGGADFGGGSLQSAGGNDIFVVKLDAAGNHVWSKLFGDAGEQFGQSIAVDGADNVLVTGRFDGGVDFGNGLLTSAGGNDVFLVKLDPAGNAVFSVRAGDAFDQRGDAVAVDASGDVLVTGRFAGALDFGGGPIVSAGGDDVFIAKFDPMGNLLWRSRAGDASVQSGLAIAFGASGTGFVAGDFLGTIDLGGTPLVSGPGGSDGFLAHFGP